MSGPCLLLLHLLLVGTATLTNSAVITENGLPVLWSQTVSQLTDLPTENGVLAPNPWQYLHRMSLYRLLIAATDPFMGSMGTNTTDSPIWGLPLQLAWELTSGRLIDPTGATTCGLQTSDPMCISTQSWWACVNYFMSVLPFLSAAQQGIMGEGVQVKMQVPAGVEDYCTTYADCAARYPEVMTKWDTFYQGLKEASESPVSDLEKRDRILGLYWEAHQASLSATEVCAARQSYYSSAEVSFANSWKNSAEYIAAVYFHSNLQRSVMFMTPLPSRVLKEGDQAPNIADLSSDENHTLSIFSWMNSMNRILGGSLVRMWRRAMCSVATREKGRALLEQLLMSPGFATRSVFAIITGIATSC
ncbi:protein LEG1 homolog [Polymixia lowei]